MNNPKQQQQQKQEQQDVKPCRILFRSKKSVELYTLGSVANADTNANANATATESSSTSVTLAQGLSTLHTFSPDGKKLLVHLPSVGVQLFDLTKEDVASSAITLEHSKAVQFMSFSAAGSYIVTYQKMNKASTADGETPSQNLLIWSSTTGKVLHGFQSKVMKRDQWPPIQWTADETLAFHLVTNEIHVYHGHVFSDTSNQTLYHDKIKCTGVSNFSVPPKRILTNPILEGKYVLSTFVPEQKGKPARISLLRYPDKCGNTENPKSGPLLVTKSFYQAEECSVKWSPKGDSALVLTHTSVDTSGDSYYGSTNLFLLLSESPQDIRNGEALSVPLPGGNSSAGVRPVLDVAWMPNGSKPPLFCVISGKMPALASLHNGTTGEPTFLFGNAHRNTIVWSNHGRFLTLGGFGNLAGGMDFYDKNKLKAIPQYDPVTGADLGTRGNTASCAVGYGWSPSSRYFMVSTTSPRMNVDNGVRLYKYNGLEIRDKSIISWDNSRFDPDLLLAAEFVPASSDEYPDRPQSPPPKRNKDGVVDGSVMATAPAVVPPPAAYVPPVGRYVPPSARGNKSGGMSLAERMRKEREGSNVGAIKVTPKTSSVMVGKKLPVGLAVEETKSKSAMKKEKQRLAKLRAEQIEKEERERKEREEKERLEAAANDPVKKAKKLNKMLKQIAELKEKDPESLNDDQRKKLATEEDVRKELESLNVS